MSSSEMETVLVVCADADKCAEIVARLQDDGASVVGSAHTAGLALALTAQMAPRSAILVGETAGRRNADELAQALSDTWGVECFVLRHDDEITQLAAIGCAAEAPTPGLEALRRARLQ
ncbi:hypothetical protein [Phenylobacterium sp.]|uniref:hypothetical protein n=1 Tax=Phenylobacterium sp. TaxID=1871053 RepID=UPI002ED9AF90